MLMIPQFTLQLIFGMALTWCIAPRAQITSGFFRIQMLVTLGLSVLTLLTLGQLPTLAELSSEWQWGLRIGCALLASTSFLGSVLWTLERPTGGTRCAFALLLMAALMVLGTTSHQPVASPLVHMHHAVTALSAGWLLGGTMSAMLLGHWYLTATGMPLLPLLRLNQWFGVAAIVRMLCAIWAGIWANWGELNTVTAALVLLHWFGLLGPLLIALMVVRILKYRNTQSATGVLYAATILVFMGEMAAALLAGSGAFPLWT